MRSRYQKIRFALFTHSYGGYFLAEKIKETYQKNQKIGKFGIIRLSKILNFDKRELKLFILLGKCNLKSLKNKPLPYQKDKTEIPIYLKVEKEVINLVIERKDKNSFANDDYERATLSPAIERVAGNALYKIDDDGVFEIKLLEFRAKYQTYYYSVVDRYKLPTSRILPFIVRLITYPN